MINKQNVLRCHEILMDAEGNETMTSAGSRIKVGKLAGSGFWFLGRKTDFRGSHTWTSIVLLAELHVSYGRTTN